MGGCSSTEDEVQNSTVNKEIAVDKKVETNIKKLLFLGSGGSGKSTLFKQLRTLHGGGFEDNDRAAFRDHIYAQIIDQMRMVIEGVETLKDDEPDQFGDLDLSDEAQAAADFVDNCRGDMDVNEEVAKNIKLLWSQDAIKRVFAERGRLKIEDSSAYFWDEVDRVAQQDYIPSDKDILFVRHRTTGVIEQKFTIKGTTFHIFDVGGQKSERKKWIHCFEHVTAVIFVASLSSYNEVLFEDESINSMDDSIDLFKEICNLRWFETTSMILFLNKQDTFAERIQTVPLTVWEPSYDGGEDYESCVAYIRDRFESQNNHREKHIYTHVTMATDKNNVEKVFGDVQHIVIDGALRGGGLV